MRIYGWLGVFTLGCLACEAHLQMPDIGGPATKAAPEPANPHPPKAPRETPDVAEKPFPKFEAAEEIDHAELSEEARQLPPVAPPDWLKRRPGESEAHLRARLRAEETTRPTREAFAAEKRRQQQVREAREREIAEAEAARVEMCSKSFPSRLAVAQSELREAIAFKPTLARMCGWARAHACVAKNAVVSVRRGGATVTERVAVVCDSMPAPYDEDQLLGCLAGSGPGGTSQLRPSDMHGPKDCSDVDPLRLEAEGPDTPEGKAILAFKGQPATSP